MTVFIMPRISILERDYYSCNHVIHYNVMYNYYDVHDCEMHVNLFTHSLHLISMYSV